MLKPISAAAAVIVASVLVVPTVSQAATVNSVRVSYADLNLASQAGERTLERRIASAARIVCQIEDTRELGLMGEVRVCRSDAVESAQPAFDSALRAARGGTVTVIGASSLIVSAP